MDDLFICVVKVHSKFVSLIKLWINNIEMNKLLITYLVRFNLFHFVASNLD